MYINVPDTLLENLEELFPGTSKYHIAKLMFCLADGLFCHLKNGDFDIALVDTEKNIHVVSPWDYLEQIEDSEQLENAEFISKSE